ncbi:MAG: vanadium-dependent haloperoxidase [Planctomycetota bacterium]
MTRLLGNDRFFGARLRVRVAAALACWVAVAAAQLDAQTMPEPAGHTPSAAYRWLDVVLEMCALDVERVGARPTILSRQMAIPLTAMYDAWAAYDEHAVGSRFGGELRRPVDERTDANREVAIAYAVYRTAVEQVPEFASVARARMVELGLDPEDETRDLASPTGVGNRVAEAVREHRRHDGANQLGDERGSDGTPYSDYTMYRPVNTPELVVDPDRWQPIPFDDGAGGTLVLGFLTPHWYRVAPFALEAADRFRPGPPPLVGSERLRREVEQCLAVNAGLTPKEKALVEFMRDGPRSTGQSGHWLKFAQAISRRDRHDLARDVQLFFLVGNVAFDAFIAAWDSKRCYDSSRPWTLIRHLKRGDEIQGWQGPGLGVATIAAAEWQPYSPATFVTPPFPGYVSGHSCVSAACAKALELFTGSDHSGLSEARRAGALTEAGFRCEEMQRLDGRPLVEILGDEHGSCDVVLDLPTFTEIAEMAGWSRVLGGYHIQADNEAGLELGRKVAEGTWPVYQRYFDGSATVRRND